jgi:hypothetical protein
MRIKKILRNVIFFCIFAAANPRWGYVLTGGFADILIKAFIDALWRSLWNFATFKNQTAQSSSECPLDVYNYCTYHTGNLHIRRGLQVACYGLVKALRRPQRERDEPIRTPRFFYCVYLVRGRG